MRQVKVGPGYSNVPIYGRTYNQGPTFSLTDSQWDALPQYIQSQLTVVAVRPDSAVSSSSGSSGVSPTSYTDDLVERALEREAVAITLTWDGTDYQPSRLKGSTVRPKTFIGPTDPNVVPGVRLSLRDQWIYN